MLGYHGQYSNHTGSTSGFLGITHKDRWPDGCLMLGRHRMGTHKDRWPNAGIKLGLHLRRWININPAMCQRIVFAGYGTIHGRCGIHILSRQTRAVGPMLEWCSASVLHGGTTSHQHWVNAPVCQGKAPVQLPLIPLQTIRERLRAIPDLSGSNRINPDLSLHCTAMQCNTIQCNAMQFKAMHDRIAIGLHCKKIVFITQWQRQLID